MIILDWLIGAALAAAQAASPPETPPSPAPPTSGQIRVTPEAFNLGAKPGKELTREEAANVLSKCGDRRFETSAEGMIGGKMRRRRMTLCALPTDTDAQWLTKLENAIIWVKAQTDLSDGVKDQLIADLRKEIARPKTVRLSPALPPANLPAADALVATVPPMPAPLPNSYAPGAIPLAASAALAPVPRPPLTIRCLGTGERGAGSRCGRLAPDTVFAVKADGNLASPATLRFLRRGEQRADVELAALRRGQMVRIKLPPEICSGIVRSEVAIQIVAGQPAPGRVARVADTLGPYPIHC